MDHLYFFKPSEFTETENDIVCLPEPVTGALVGRGRPL